MSDPAPARPVSGRPRSAGVSALAAAALAGISSAAFGAGSAHLVAAVTDPASSPVLAVGSTVIDLTPTPVKEWAVREFGTADKPVLLSSVVLGTLLLAAAAGVIARTRPWRGAALQAALVVLAGALALSRPRAGIADVVPSLVALVLGPAALLFLIHRLRGAGTTRALPDGPPSGSATRRDPEPSSGPGEPAAPSPAGSRRGFLIGSGVTLLSGAVLAGAGRWVVRARSRLADIVLPAAAEPEPALPPGLDRRYPGITALRTPNADFYRVDTKLSVPLVDHGSWRLRVDGEVDHPFELSYRDLLDLDLVEHDITLTCVSNEVGGNLLGGARWLGVPVAGLLERAGVQDGADQVLSTDVDGFTISTPLAALTDGRPALVAVGMNGEVLPRAHGFPARLVVPGLYGFVGATKWLTRMTLTRYDRRSAYWTDRGWATQAPIKISSRIDTPRPLASLKAGEQVIGGVAWAQHLGVAAVEVQVDGGPWRRAELGPDIGVDYWRQWFVRWSANPGRHELAVRAIGSDGSVQTGVRATPFPDGSSGIQRIVVMVA